MSLGEYRVWHVIGGEDIANKGAHLKLTIRAIIVHLINGVLRALDVYAQLRFAYGGILSAHR
jgi:hypothetical protein